MFKTPEQYRVTKGRVATPAGALFGAFVVPMPTSKATVKAYVIASNQMGWEHVSVSLDARAPTWAEMCFVKGLFWDDTDWVVQFHPAESDYVNDHPRCLHLWRPVGTSFPTPPKLLV
ncbi:hypothetical protein UFOVP703_79 [uncultured Caudovirales phage]|uniref:DUF7694 domain-containing protein n=1 Tax=uncultured Caudovirales phage TaxID=2100421 RepID=A0A6J5NKN4_9CAUD|nr:hypothetical protein UFOVP703_79 [uncultured Caudovirales phage]